MSSAPATPETSAFGKPIKADHSVVLTPYPNIIFLWPAYVAGIVAAIYMHFSTGSVQQIDAQGIGAAVVGWTFLILLSLNLVVLAFDFPRGTSLTLFFVIVALVLGGVQAILHFPNVLPRISDWIKSIHPQANAAFYYLFSAAMTAIYIGVRLSRRFDRWEVRHNELLHHHGFMSDLERFPSPNLRVDKEINDVFEYMLCRSGRLILHPSNERRAIVLDNVPFISTKEDHLQRLLGTLQVEVRKDIE